VKLTISLKGFRLKKHNTFIYFWHNFLEIFISEKNISFIAGSYVNIFGIKIAINSPKVISVDQANPNELIQ
jgi:hypothetical protein